MYGHKMRIRRKWEKMEQRFLDTHRWRSDRRGKEVLCFLPWTFMDAGADAEQY
jgi:hypothetical protein